MIPTQDRDEVQMMKTLLLSDGNVELPPLPLQPCAPKINGKLKEIRPQSNSSQAEKTEKSDGTKLPEPLPPKCDPQNVEVKQAFGLKQNISTAMNTLVR